MADKYPLKVTIDGDAKGAQAALAAVNGQVNKLGNDLTRAFATPAMAAAGIAAVGASIAAIGKQIFDITASTAAVGSAIQDVADKTGLTAGTVSALKYAAEQSGTSIDALTKGFNAFNVQLGEAARGNTKAAESLRSIGVTSTQTDDALGQLISSIQNARSSNEQMAIAVDALGKKAGPELVVMVRQGSGSLDDMRETVKKLGIGFDNDGARRAKDFDDTLLQLKQQATGVSTAFAVEVMPAVTSAMTRISGAMETNRGIAQDWGRFTGETFRGAEVILSSLADRASFSMDSINAALQRNIGVVVDWRMAWLSSMGVVGQTISMLAGVGKDNPGVVRVVGDEYSLTRIPTGTPPPKIVPDRVRAAGASKTAAAGKDNSAADAEKARRDAIAQARLVVDRTLEIYGVGNEKRIADLDQALALGFIKEIEHVQKVARVRLEALMDEERQKSSLLANDKIKLSDEERAALLQEIRILQEKIKVEKVVGSTQITSAINREAKAQRALADIEKERLQRLKEMRAVRQFNAGRQELDAKHQAQLQSMVGSGSTLSQWGSLQSELFELHRKGEIGETQFLGMTAGVDALRASFEGLGQAIGQAVNAWVLYGQAGASVQQVTAQILAGVAQQAAVKAVFELAEGFAALAKAFFGIPNAGPAAAAHFKAAAIYGAVAGVSAGIGRGVAGGSFKKDAAGGGVGTGSSRRDFSNQDPYQRQSQYAFLSGRNNPDFGRLVSIMDRLDRKLDTARPGDVLVKAVNERPGLIAQTVQKDVQRNSSLGSGIARSMGFS